MASTKFEVSMEIFKFQGEPDVSVTLTGKSPTELDTALKTLETIAKTTTLYNGDSAPEAEKSVTSEPKQAAPVVSMADKKAPKKPVSWLTPVGAKGLMLLRCPKECPDRHPGCHDHCERYAENKEAYQKMKQEYDGSVRNPYCRRWTHRAIVRSFKKKFR